MKNTEILHQNINQRISFSKKIANEHEWGKQNILQIEQEYLNTFSPEYYERMDANFKMYANEFDQDYFRKQFNPMGIEVGQFEDKIEAYNKAPLKIQVLLGDESSKHFKPTALLVNGDAVKAKAQEAQEAVIQALFKRVNDFIEKVSDRYSGMYDDSPEMQEKLQAEIQRELDNAFDAHELDVYSTTNYLSAKEIMANQLLNFLIKQDMIRDKMNDGFKYLLLSAIEAVWVGIRKTEPTILTLNSKGLIVLKSPETKFIQDGYGAGYKSFASSKAILLDLGDMLKEEDIKKLEHGGEYGFGASNVSLSNKQYQHTHHDIDYKYNKRAFRQNINKGQYGNYDTTDEWEITHTEWVSQRKIGIVDTINIHGEIEKFIVDEHFEVPPHAEKVEITDYYSAKRTKYVFDNYSLEWLWVPEVWEGTLIGSDIYCNIRPKKEQFTSVDNPYYHKLGYHGIILNDTNSEPVSLMDRISPFQLLFIAIVTRIKKLIQRDRGTIFHIDTTMIDPNIGVEKTMYYLEELGIDFFNPLHNAESPGAAQRGKVTGNTSLSNMQYIQNYVQLMDAIDNQISEVAGIPKGREGQIGSQEAVTNAQQNLVQSTVATELYFRPHFQLWEQVLTSLIKTAQIAYRGKHIKKQYILDDLSISLLDVDMKELQDEDLGIFISNASENKENIKILKDWVHALIQNDKAKLSDLIKIMRSNSFEDISRDIVKSEARTDQQMQEQQAAEQEMQQQQIEAMRQVEAEKMNLEIQLAELDAQTRIKVAEINAMSKMINPDLNNNGVPDVLELDKLRAQRDILAKKLEIEEKKLQNVKANTSSKKK